MENAVNKLCVLLKFFNLNKSIVVNEGVKIFMKDDKKLYKQKYGKKEKRYNPSYEELLKLASSINDTIFERIENIVINGGDDCE